jgi:hypothetical protein
LYFVLSKSKEISKLNKGRMNYKDSRLHARCGTHDDTNLQQSHSHSGSGDQEGANGGGDGTGTVEVVLV